MSKVEPEFDDPEFDILALDEVLQKFARIYPRKAELVKLRFFAGLTIEQAAQILNIAPSTAIEDWAFAKCWLRLELSDEAD
jgi:DNA-directed RNA polymerase specialized sigma24 family protein